MLSDAIKPPGVALNPNLLCRHLSVFQSLSIARNQPKPRRRKIPASHRLESSWSPWSHLEEPPRRLEHLGGSVHQEERGVLRIEWFTITGDRQNPQSSDRRHLQLASSSIYSRSGYFCASPELLNSSAVDL
jgi:hypothetical protein